MFPLESDGQATFMKTNPEWYVFLLQVWTRISNRERGNHLIQAYLSFVQRKTLELICNVDVMTLVELAPKLGLKTPNKSISNYLKWTGHKTMNEHAFMLDGWEVCLYVVILSFQQHLWTKI